MIVYLATKGDYDEYRVIGVFSSRDRAEACYTYDDSILITPFEVDALYEPLISNQKLFEVEMKRDGTVVEVEKLQELEAPDYYIWDTSLVNRCFAKTKEEAVRKTDELRQELVANGGWR